MRSRIFEPLLTAYTIDLPHRFLVSVVSAPDLNGIGIMDDPVQNGIRNGCLRELAIPAGRSELRAEDGRRPLMSPMDNLQQISGLRFCQGDEHPLVQNEQVCFLPLGQYLLKAALTSGNSQFLHTAWKL